MKPSAFGEMTKLLNPPKSKMENECKELPIYTDGKECISLWVPSFWERLKLLIYGEIWVRIYSGATQPPICIMVDYPFGTPRKIGFAKR